MLCICCRAIKGQVWEYVVGEYGMVVVVMNYFFEIFVIKELYYHYCRTQSMINFLDPL